MSETKTAHTPTPWKTCFHEAGALEQDSAVALEIYEDNDGNGFTIAEVSYSNYGKEEATANMEFICRACNAHDELVAVCKEVLVLVENNYDFHYDLDGEAEGIRNLLRAALAKATENQP